jgi:glycosyltransferase involved in cell wall biosynthesis
VIVLYDERAEDSLTVRTLRDVLRSDTRLASQFLICLYDNSPLPQPVPEGLFPARTHVFQPAENRGLAAAYNHALTHASAAGASYLLLLDSDTCLTSAFLGACTAMDAVFKTQTKVAAAVPHIVEGNTIHSPRYAAAFRRRAVPLDFSGTATSEVLALNSGTLLRMEALRDIGGFNSEFWLDYLDYWLFRVLQRRGYFVYVLEARLEHSLSLQNPLQRMSPFRYANMIAAERFFVARYGTQWERFRMRLVMLKRAIKLAAKAPGSPHFRAALSAAFGSYADATAPPAPGQPL